MAEFDPDLYLRQRVAPPPTAFNPDAYLQQTAPTETPLGEAFDPDAYLGTPKKEAQPSDHLAFTRGFVSSLLQQQPELAGHALGALSEVAPEGLSSTLKSGSQYLIDKSKELNPKDYAQIAPKFGDISGIGDALTWAGETLGSGLASTLGPIATGAAGAAGGALVGGPIGAVVGGLAGGAIGATPLNLGEVHKALLDEGIPANDAAKYALAVLPAMSALDVAGEALPVARLMGLANVRREAARTIAKRIAVEAGKAAGTEGITEGAQEAVKAGTVSIATGKPFLTKENALAIAENAIGGALVGGVTGGVSGIRRDEATAGVVPGQLAAIPGQPPTTPGATPAPVDLANLFGVTPTAPVPPSNVVPLVTPSKPLEVTPADTTVPSNVIDFLTRKTKPLTVTPEPPTTPGAPVTPQFEKVEPDTRMPQAEEIKSQPGANVARLAVLLGPKLYGEPSQLPKVTVKEILQNSFDAVKTMVEQGKISEGKIDIRMDPKTRTIEFVDNGSGMTPDVLANQFLQIAGTSKESERASGGLGIAKMLFLFANKNLEVTTMRGGKVARLVTTGEKLFSALQDKSQAPTITVRPPHPVDMAMFPNGHGTHIRVTVPQKYTDSSTGEVKNIEFNDMPWHHDVLEHSPLFGNIAVTFNGSPLGIGKHFALDDYTQFANVNFKWGTARIYVSKKEQKQYGASNARVLSNGLWQFNSKIAKNPAEPYGDSINRQFFIDLDSKAKPEESGYPFDLNRQQFTKQAMDDFGKIFNYISKLYAQVDFSTSVKNFGDMQYLMPTGKGVTYTKQIKVEPKAPPTSHAANLIQEGDKVEIQDGKLIVNGRKIPELSKKDLENFSINVDELKIDQKDINSNAVLVHDNTDVVVKKTDVLGRLGLAKPLRTLDETLGGKPVTQWGREKFGARFDEFIYGIGNAFKELRDVVADVMHYPELRKEGVGVSFDVEYRGVSIVVPFNGLFINPAVPEFSDVLRAAVGMVGTMVHELAHHKVRSHNAEFPAEMQRIIIHLDTHPTFNFHEFKQRVVDIVSRHRDVFDALNGVFKDGGIYTVQPRGKRFKESGTYEARDGSTTGDVAQPGVEPASQRRLLAEASDRQGTSTGEPGRTDVRPTLEESRADPDGLAANQRAHDSETRGIPAVARQEETIGPRKQATAASGGTTPPHIAQAAAHADKMSWWYKWMAGLDQLVHANPRFTPLLQYYETMRAMHLDEAKLQDVATRVSKSWRKLGRVQADALTGFLNDVANMSYRSATEVAQGVKRHPTPQEVTALVQKHKLSGPAQQVAANIRKFFNDFLDVTATNAMDEAKKIITDPKELADRLNQIQQTVTDLKSRPYFPFMRFGRHYVQVKNAANNTVHMETFEGSLFKSAERKQEAKAQELRNHYGPNHTVTVSMFPEEVEPMIGMPPALLSHIQTKLQLTPAQLDALEQLQYQMSPSLSFRHHFQHKSYVPGYSMDFRRSFARYAFHGARYYARTKYASQLQDFITAARAIDGNKPAGIADYMADHLKNTVLDAKGDFGIFKGAIFLWAMGYVPAAATQNLSQTPMITLPFLGAKYGDIRATKAILKAMTDITSFYKRGNYGGQTAFDMRALDYGIKAGRISETQAAELASMSSGSPLLEGIGGNRLQRMWTQVMEKGAVMFELAEQFNRRVAYRAALHLALENPNAKGVKEAVAKYASEYQSLLSSFTPAEATAIIAASHAVDQTQYVYARYARPRFMRGRIPGTLFVFKKYMQSTLFLLGQNKSDVLPRYLAIAALVGGLGGIPGWDDFKELLRAYMYWAHGKDFNVDRAVREYVNMFAPGGPVPADMVLHGLARRGLGIPALLDMMGSFATGTPGRGFDPATQAHSKNIPFPVIDRSRALSMGNILPFEAGKLFGPQKDVNSTIADQTQKASGAVFSVAFNLYKAIVDNDKNLGDRKRWERAVPRLLGSASKAFRALNEGRERGKGGPNSAATIVRYDWTDPEQAMEIAAMAMGYQPLRQQAKWDMIMAQQEVKTFWDLKHTKVLGDLHDAIVAKDPVAHAAAAQALKDFNAELPKYMKGKSITGDTALKSVQARERERIARETGVPSHLSEVPLARYINKLFPETTIDVRRVR